MLNCELRAAFTSNPGDVKITSSISSLRYFYLAHKLKYYYLYTTGNNYTQFNKLRLVTCTHCNTLREKVGQR